MYVSATPADRLQSRVAFVGGRAGQWTVSAQQTWVGASLPPVRRLSMQPAAEPSPEAAQWRFEGFTSNARYATRHEISALRAVQEGLGRPQARHAALILIRKSPAWWALAQDERRAIFEESSRHTAIGLAYLPAVARQLHHSRDLGEPFDFLTWFEFPADTTRRFEQLVRALRATPEWDYVDREVELRLERAA